MPTLNPIYSRTSVGPKKGKEGGGYASRVVSQVTPCTYRRPLQLLLLALSLQLHHPFRQRSVLAPGHHFHVPKAWSPASGKEADAVVRPSGGRGARVRARERKRESSFFQRDARDG